MKLITIDAQNESCLREAALMACSVHGGLREVHPWIPARRPEDFLPRIEWMAREGMIHALTEGGRLVSFLGWFPLDNFRNAGPGAFTPDWCLGVDDRVGPEASARMPRQLLRTALEEIRNRGIHIHAAGLPAHRADWLEALSLTGYGRIVMDAARPAQELARELNSASVSLSDGEAGSQPAAGAGGVTIRRAVADDAQVLARLDRSLADHIAASPVFMPNTSGSCAAEWEEWLADPDNFTWVAEISDSAILAKSVESAKASESVGIIESAGMDAHASLIAFIKAGPPQFDVSYSVHDSATLAVCGLWVEPGFRGAGLASRLTSALTRDGLSAGKTMISVDCETHNLEAFGFWTRHFRPLSWSLERRFD